MPQITGGLVKIPEDMHFSADTLAWRGGGANDINLPTYPRPHAPSAAATSARRSTRHERGPTPPRSMRSRSPSTPLGARAPYTGGAKVSAIGLRLSASGALTAHAEEAAKVGPNAFIPKLLSAKPPCPTVVMAACKEARCNMLCEPRYCVMDVTTQHYRYTRRL